jgi:dihydrofolate reductase
MLVSLITAMDCRGLIGNETGLPWHLPRDLRRFRACTWGKPILMGRRTFESIGKPLPGRFSIVLSQAPDFTAPGCRVTRTFQEAVSIAEEYLRSTAGNEVMVIGGGKVYAEALPRCDRLYLTLVEGEFAGNTYFPIRELLCQSWRLAGEPESCPADEKNPYPHTFCIIERAGDGSEKLDLAALLARGTKGP